MLKHTPFSRFRFEMVCFTLIASMLAAGLTALSQKMRIEVPFQVAGYVGLLGLYLAAIIVSATEYIKDKLQN